MAGRIEYKIILKPLRENPSTLRDCVGAVVNIRNRHWVALRYDAGVTWLLDSQEHGPQVLSEAEYKAFIRKHKKANAMPNKTSKTAATAKIPSSIAMTSFVVGASPTPSQEVREILEGEDNITH